MVITVKAIKEQFFNKRLILALNWHIISIKFLNLLKPQKYGIDEKGTFILNFCYFNI